MLFKTCIETLNIQIDPSELDFAHVRKAYLRAALASHPDKNDGDQAKFLAVQEAFESIKSATNNGTTPLSAFVGKSLDAVSSVSPPRSAAFYEAAAAAFPAYKVERAKSGRGKCSAIGDVINEGELKVGSLVPELGDYGRFVKLNAWKVPNAIQACLTPGVDPTTNSVKADLLE